MKNKTITIFHPYTHASSINIEKWLRKKANSGWRLIEENNCFFTFRECTPYDGFFLMHSDFGAESVMYFEFLKIKEKYGIPKTKSDLNKTATIIFEIDKTKPNYEIVAFKKKRNKYYKKHYGSFSIFSGIPILFLIYDYFFTREKDILFLLCLTSLVFLHCFSQFIIIRRHSKDQ